MHPFRLPFSAARVLIAGDLILDRYWFGNTSRISPEAPVPVVKIERREERPGGAANVALNVRGLGAAAILIGVTGEDAAAGALADLLRARAVDCRLQAVAGVSTVTKLRVLSQHQQLLRLDFENDLAGMDGALLHRQFTQALDDVDIVVFSDYAKGTLAGIAGMIATARAAGKKVIIDPKGSDVSRYRGATLITPNLKEFHAIVGPAAEQAVLEEKARNLCTDLDFEAILVTQGEHGMTLIERAGGATYLPARAAEVFDVTGAGDTVVATLAAALAAGHTLVQATALANRAAGLVVAKLGAVGVDAAELEAALQEASQNDPGIVSEDLLIEAVRAARLRGQTIVMTNGCFDILHLGHIKYLQQARALGDKLIVAVNDDASVRRLKGEARPINGLQERMAVLQALACVDWVISFAEDTPYRLISRVLPDVLVKGGDYAPEEVVGADRVKAHGGEVRIIGYIEGYSTSGMIAALARKPEQVAP